MPRKKSPVHENGWAEHKKLVMDKLNTIEDELIGVRKFQQTILVEIAVLKVKSGVWGLIGGGIAVIIGLGITAVKSSL